MQEYRLSGPGGIRTLDLFSAIEARSQLRYRPFRRTTDIVQPEFSFVKVEIERARAIASSPPAGAQFRTIRNCGVVFVAQPHKQPHFLLSGGRKKDAIT